MSRLKHSNKRITISVTVVLLLALVSISGFFAEFTEAGTSCPAADTSKGIITQNFSVPTSGTYKVWSRIMAPDSTRNSYILEIDDSDVLCNVVVGDAVIPSNQWTWVDYRDGNTASKVTANIPAGTHAIRMVGRETNVRLDRIIITADLTCMPSGTGDNCAESSTVPPPTCTFTGPKAGEIDGVSPVSAHDLSLLLSHFNQTNNSYPAGDFDSDCSITAHDLSMLLANFGK